MKASERRHRVYDALVEIAGDPVSTAVIAARAGLTIGATNDTIFRLKFDGIITCRKVPSNHGRVFTILTELTEPTDENWCAKCSRPIKAERPENDHPRCAACGILIGPRHEETRLVGPFDPDCLRAIYWRLKYGGVVSPHTMKALRKWLGCKPQQLVMFEERRAA